MFQEAADHVKRSFDHVVSGESSTLEKVEVGAGVVVAAAAALLTRSAALRLLPTARTGLESLPRLELSTANTAAGAEALTGSSMTPKAFKVLTGDHALYDSQFKYPLPKMGKDGQWIPGDWITTGHSENVKHIQTSINGRANQKVGLFISDKPQLWRAGTPGRTTYEVEIGDAASKDGWNSAIVRSDFVAQKIRLLRPLSDSDLSALPRPTALDRLGGIANSPDQVLRLQKMERDLASGASKGIVKNGKRLGDSPEDYAVDPDMSSAERLLYLKKMVLGLER